jgi:hypothetical protein
VYTLESRVQVVRLDRLLRRELTRRVVRPLLRRAGGAQRDATRPVAALARAMDGLWQAGRRAAGALRPLPEGVRVLPIDRFDGRFDELWRRVSPGYPVAVRRDARYLEWRYRAYPGRTYEVAAAERDGALVGYVVYYSAARHGLLYGHLVDFLVDRGDPAARDALFAHATRELERAGVDLTTVYVPPRDEFFREGLKRRGFLVGWPKHPMLARDEDDRIGAAHMANRDGWFFTRGDSDLDVS